MMKKSHTLLATQVSTNLVTTLLASMSACLLVACGGAGLQNESAQPPVSNSPVPTEEFTALSKEASCANLRNRMFVIDQKQVLWDKAGSCADAAYSVTLFGNTPKLVLCSSYDSIAGPRTTCEDAKNTDYFNTILNNLDKADLGLGSSHQVTPITLPPGLSVNVPFSAINSAFYRGNAPANIVIQDKTAWKNFITDGKIDLAMTGVQDPDFTYKMVLGTFYPTNNDCSKTQILKLSTNGQTLKVSYAEDEIISFARCDGSNAQASTPMSLVETLRIKLPTEFSNVSKQRLTFKTIDSEQISAIKQSKNIVIKDQATWANLWKEHKTSTQVLPNVDFSKNMLIAVFLGERPSACHSLRDLTIWRSDGKINVTHNETTPGPLTKCAYMMVAPAVIVEIPKSDEAVEFNSITTPL